VPRPQVSGLLIAFWKRLRPAWAQLRGWVRGQGRTAGGVPARDGAPTTRVEAGGGRGDARTRFWTEFRAGQREAEARIAGRTP
jgi:hypothetical protein